MADNNFDRLEEGRVHLVNGITELERNLDEHTLTGAELEEQIHTALVDLRAAREIIREVTGL